MTEAQKLQRAIELATKAANSDKIIKVETDVHCAILLLCALSHPELKKFDARTKPILRMMRNDILKIVDQMAPGFKLAFEAMYTE